MFFPILLFITSNSEVIWSHGLLLSHRLRASAVSLALFPVPRIKIWVTQLSPFLVSMIILCFFILLILRCRKLPFLAHFLIHGKRRYCALHVRPSVCLSVCLSVTSRTDEKMRPLSLTTLSTELHFLFIFPNYPQNILYSYSPHDRGFLARFN
jgi:hypothetical protein